LELAFKMRIEGVSLYAREFQIFDWTLRMNGKTIEDHRRWPVPFRGVCQFICSPISGAADLPWRGFSEK
jgi:hypothetical protein